MNEDVHTASDVDIQGACSPLPQSFDNYPLLVQKIDSFCEALRVERNASAHTIRNYRSDLQAYARWVKRNSIDPFHSTYRDLRGYLADMDAARYERSTISRHLSSLRTFYEYCELCGICTQNPVSSLQGPRQGNRLPRYIRPEDIKKLLSVYDPDCCTDPRRIISSKDIRNFALLELLYASGARVSEISDLRIANIDFQNKQIKVFGKGAKERIIPIHERAISALKTYLDTARNDLLSSKQLPFVFVSSRGNQLSDAAIRYIFKRALVRAGLDESLSPHDIRHTFATDMLNGGADLRSVQTMLGHSSLSSTQIYTHLTKDKLREVHIQAHPRG